MAKEGIPETAPLDSCPPPKDQIFIARAPLESLTLAIPDLFLSLNYF